MSYNVINNLDLILVVLIENYVPKNLLWVYRGQCVGLSIEVGLSTEVGLSIEVGQSIEVGLQLFCLHSFSLTHSHTMTPFDAPVKQAF